MNKNKQRYIVPPDRMFDRLAFRTCDALGDDFNQPEIKAGLAGMLKQIRHIIVNYGEQLEGVGTDGS